MKSIISLLVAIAIFPINFLRADEVAEEIRALKKQIEELSQKVQVLEGKASLAGTNSKANMKEVPVVSAGADGFTMRSADTNFVLRVRGYGQFDGRFYGDDNPA